ncbi:MAG: hypothetical protein ACR2LR_13625 [Hassallia sp.]
MRMWRMNGGDSWLHAVRRCSRHTWGKFQSLPLVIRGFMPLGVAQESNIKFYLSHCGDS